MSMRVITPRSTSPSVTGRILTPLSAMIVEASARVASGGIMITSFVITSSTVTPALLSASSRYSSQLPRGIMPPRMSRKPGAFTSASLKMRSPSVTMPMSLPLSTTGAPEMPVSAKSLMAASTVSSGPSVGHSSCTISATFISRMSCCSTSIPLIVVLCHYLTGPKNPRSRLPLPPHGLNTDGPPGVEVELDERSVEQDGAARGDRDATPVSEEQGEKVIPFEPDDAVLAAGHAHVGHVRRSTGQDDEIRRGHVRVGPEHGLRPPIEIMAERQLLARGLGVRIDEHEVDALFLQLGDGPVRGLEGRHLRPLYEHASQHVGDAHGYASGPEEAPSRPGVFLSEVGGTHHPAVLFEELPVAFSVKSVISQGQKVGDGEQGRAALARDPAPRGRRVLGVGNDGVEVQLFAQPRHEVEGGGASRGPDHVPDEEQPEAQSSSLTALGRYSSKSVATMLSAGQPVSSVQSSAARPWAQAPALAASYVSIPRERSAPITPDKTSPVPAVARATSPVELTATFSPFTTSVSEPLSSTQQSFSSAAMRAEWSLRADTSPVPDSSNLPSSPACGVSTVG